MKRSDGWCYFTCGDVWFLETQRQSSKVTFLGFNPLTHLTHSQLGIRPTSRIPRITSHPLQNNTNLSPMRKLCKNLSDSIGKKNPGWDLILLTGYISLDARSIFHSKRMNWGVNDSGGRGAGGWRKVLACKIRPRLTQSPNLAGGIKETGSFVNKFVLQDETDSFISNERHIESILFHLTPTCFHVNIPLNWFKYVRIFHEGVELECMHVCICIDDVVCICICCSVLR